MGSRILDKIIFQAAGQVGLQLQSQSIYPLHQLTSLGYPAVWDTSCCIPCKLTRLPYNNPESLPGFEHRLGTLKFQAVLYLPFIPPQLESFHLIL